MTKPTYNPTRTGLLFVDPYNDFLSEGLWPRVKEVAEQVRLIENLKAIVKTVREKNIQEEIAPLLPPDVQILSMYHAGLLSDVDTLRYADRCRLRHHRQSGNPAIPAYGSRLLQSDRVDVGYATIFPSMTIVKVVAAQITIGLTTAATG